MSISRLSMAFAAVLIVAGCDQAPAPEPAPTRPEEATPHSESNTLTGPERRILAFGDSLFAGYGLTLEQSYPAKLEAALRSKGINVRIANAAVSGDTTAAGRQRFAFALDGQDPPPDLILLELGANDMLRSLPVAQTRANLAAILDEAKKRGIKVVIMGMRAPPNLGADYQRNFDALYPDLAREYGATLVPFWLQAIYDKPALFQADRLHPTEAGLELLAKDTADEIAAALPPPQD